MGRAVEQFTVMGILEGLQRIHEELVILYKCVFMHSIC